MYEKTRKLGLIGKILDHSFSGEYFNNKFKSEGLPNWEYNLYPIENIEKVRTLMDVPNLIGFNVTIPYKTEIIPYLDRIETLANAIGAVNTVAKIDNQWVGFNTDIDGLNIALTSLLDQYQPKKAFILGSGGASKAALHILSKRLISTEIVSRNGNFTYTMLNKLPKISDALFINCTPIGTYPKIEEYLPLPYKILNKNVYFIDMVYNPALTKMMQLFAENGAIVTNGYSMLVGQAEASWKIWSNIRIT